MIRCKKVLFFITSMSVFLLFACPTAAPLQQRDASKTALERAKSVMAEVFAKEKYSVALDNFKTGEGLINKEKKTKQNAQALKNYEISKQNAELAHAEAIGPYADSLLKEAQVQITLSKEEGFVENNIEHFDTALSNVEAAKMSLQEKNYDDFFAKIKEFEQNMALARDLFAALIARLDAVKAREKAIDQEAIAKKVLNAAPQEYQKAIESKEGAFMALREKTYEKAITFFEESIAQLEKVLVVIEEKRRMASEELNRAEEVLENVEDRVQEQSEQAKNNAKPNMEKVLMQEKSESKELQRKN